MASSKTQRGQARVLFNDLVFVRDPTIIELWVRSQRLRTIGEMAKRLKMTYAAFYWWIKTYGSLRNLMGYDNEGRRIFDERQVVCWFLAGHPKRGPRTPIKP